MSRGGSEVQVPGWPVLTVGVLEDGSALLNGQPVLPAAGLYGRAAAIVLAGDTATQLGRPVRVEVTEADGLVWLLAVAPDGTESVITAPEVGKRGKGAKGKRGAKGRSQTGDSEAPEDARPTHSRLADMFAEPGVEPGTAEPAPEFADLPTAGEFAAVPSPPVSLDQYPTVAVTSTPTPLPAAPAEHPLPALIGEAVSAADWPAAELMAARLQSELAPGSTELDQAHELSARIAALSGEYATATDRYRALAADLAVRYGPGDPDAIRLAFQAHACWERVADRHQALELGRELLLLRELIPAPEAVQRVRARLARLHLNRGA